MSRIGMAEELSPEDVSDIRQILADIRAGRRIACFAWKFLAVVGGISVAVIAAWSQWESGVHLMRGP